MSVNDDQKTCWSSQAGQSWVQQQAAMDALLKPVLDLVLENANLQSGDVVMDIGCGAGTSTQLAAQSVGPSGHVTGLDISATLLQRAADISSASNIGWLCSDAQTHDFEIDTYDAVISRFGVMFFEDTTAAFTNIAGAVRSGGRFTMAAWACAGDNPWFMQPAAAARAVLGPMPKTDRTQPGPFAFEDAERIIPMLARAGLDDITCISKDVHLAGSGTAKDAADLCCIIGPAASAIEYFNASSAQQAALRDEIEARFSCFDTALGLKIPASIHLYQARAK